MLAFDLLRVFFANCVFLGINMALVGAPPIGIEAADPKRLEQGLQLQKDRILPSPKDIGQYGPTVVINRML